MDKSVTGMTIQEKLEQKIDNFSCYNSHTRLVNFVIYNEYIMAKRDGRRDWADRASRWLQENHGIERTPGTLISTLASIKNGSRSSLSSSGFAGENLEPQSRYEKDIFYGRVEVYIHEFLCDYDKCYVGLPANQLVAISKKYDKIVACEKDLNMSLFIKDLNKFVIKNPNIVIEHQDIFDYLSSTNEKFNVFDLDLMTYLTERKIKNIGYVIKKAAARRAVIALISIGGRHISIKEYKELMPDSLINEIERNNDWSVISCLSGKYKDVKMPMFWEILTIEENIGQL